jgi:hypothetical protein
VSEESTLDFLQCHLRAASVRVATIRGRIEGQLDIVSRHQEMGEAAGLDVWSRLEALQRDLMYAEAVRTAVEGRAKARSDG